jgi:hypothetical protein
MSVAAALLASAMANKRTKAAIAERQRAAAAWPLFAHAQQPAIPTVGFVRITTPQDSAHLVTAFGLKGVVFRGHRDAIHYRITSTLSRHHKAPYNPRTSWQVDEMLRHFLGNLQ